MLLQVWKKAKHTIWNSEHFCCRFSKDILCNCKLSEWDVYRSSSWFYWNVAVIEQLSDVSSEACNNVSVVTYNNILYNYLIKKSKLVSFMNHFIWNFSSYSRHPVFYMLTRGHDAKGRLSKTVREEKQFLGVKLKETFSYFTIVKNVMK